MGQRLAPAQSVRRTIAARRAPAPTKHEYGSPTGHHQAPRTARTQPQVRPPIELRASFLLSQEQLELGSNPVAQIKNRIDVLWLADFVASALHHENNAKPHLPAVHAFISFRHAAQRK